MQNRLINSRALYFRILHTIFLNAGCYLETLLLVNHELLNKSTKTIKCKFDCSYKLGELVTIAFKTDSETNIIDHNQPMCIVLCCLYVVEKMKYF